MVKKLFLSVALLANTITSFGQCTESATGFGNNTSTSSYNVDGDVSITYQNDQLTFKTASNYSTANGPDVRVYLVDSEGKTDQQIKSTDISDMPNIPFGLVGFSGEQEITIDAPRDIELSDYDTVFFFCFEFSAFWDFGKINLSNFDNCSLSIKSLEKINKVEIYPNPTTDNIYIKGSTAEFSQYQLLDMQGRIVKQSTKVLNTIDIHDLSKGLYTLFLYSGTSYEVEKIVVE